MLYGQWIGERLASVIAANYARADTLVNVIIINQHKYYLMQIVLIQIK